MEEMERSKTMTIGEFRKLYNIGHNKAYQLVHYKGFPCVFVGKKCLIITSKVDKWLEEHIGETL